MNFRKLMNLFLVFSISTTVGCKPMNRNAQETESVVNTWDSFLEELEEIAPNEVESHISMEVSEFFVLDADIVISDELETYLVENIEMSRHLFYDKETILQKLIDSTGIVPVGEPVSQQKDDKLEDGTYMTLLSVDGENGENIQVRDAYLNVNMVNGKKRAWPLDVFTEKQSVHDYIKQMEEPIDLHFLSVEEVTKQAEELGKELGIEYSCESIVYCCSEERLKSVAQQHKAYYAQIGWSDTESDWSVEQTDEQYFVCLQQGYKGIPLIPYDASMFETGANWMTGSQSVIQYFADGSIDISIANVYDMKAIGETNEILSLADIFDLHYKEYLTTKETVIKVQLYYVPFHTEKGTLNFIARPVWYVLSNMEYGEEVIRKAVLYDATTGDVIEW